MATIPNPIGPATQPRIPPATRRIVNEFLEMPGLTLTVAQAARLFDLETWECDSLLQGLLDGGFLVRAAGGTVQRRSPLRVG
jgi:hypothetical protein